MDWTEIQFEKMISKYQGVEYIYDKAVGCIAWRYATGNNLEILELEASVRGIGKGLLLYKMMVEQIVKSGKVPRHSIVAYRRTSNEAAARFYNSMGWAQVDLGNSIYPEGGTTLIWTTWNQLVALIHKVYNS